MTHDHSVTTIRITKEERSLIRYVWSEDMTDREIYDRITVLCHDDYVNQR
jgi:hypothetical protein